MASMWKGGARSFGLLSVAALTTLALAACAKSAAPSSGGTGSPPAATGSIAVATASVSGMGKVLVDAKGFTLYYLKSETPGTIKCTGSCATNWPPLLLPPGATSATAGNGVNASALGTIKRPDAGTQVTYKGMPLYLFAGDQSAGQATGQGVSNFYVVTTSGSGAPSPSSGGGGGGVPGY